MEKDHAYRQFVLRMTEARRPEEKSWIRFQETLETAILGNTVSVGRRHRTDSCSSWDAEL